MSPPMSQTWREIWSFSSLSALGKKSSRLAIMQMNAEGSSIRPISRAHFPVQHIFPSLLFLLFLAATSPNLLSLQVSEPLFKSEGKSVKYGRNKKKKEAHKREKLTSLTLRKSNTAGGSKGRKERGNKGQVLVWQPAIWFQTCVSTH